MYSATLIISFYNNTDALRCILTSLANQCADNRKLFEVIIADDGSKPDNVVIVQKLISSSPLSIQYVAQLDNGFRKNRILNKAVHIANSDYLIFIDGDCIPQEHFVADHLANAEPGYVLNGRRVDLPSYYRDKLWSNPEPNRFFKIKSLSIFSGYLIGRGKNIEKGLRIKNKFLSKQLNRKYKGIVGCNFSLYRSDFIAINGFNNNYEVASIGEDTDIQYRLEANGIKIKNIFYCANMLHIMHTELPRLQEALDIYNESVKNNQIVVKNGYNEAYDKD